MLLCLLACVPAPEGSPDGVITPLDGDDTASDSSGDTGWDSGEDSPSLPPVEDAPVLLLNEAMSANTCSLGIRGDTPDYLELYNASARTVTMDRVAVWDASGAIWVGDPAWVIEPGGWFTLYADGKAGSPDHAPFTLAAAGDTLTVAVDGQVTDRLGLGLLPDDLAWARFPDGGAWDLTGLATPTASNGAGPAAFVDPFTDGFSIDQLHEISVALSDASYTALNRAPTTYVEGSLTFDDLVVEPVGVRVRGSSTFQPINQKPSLKLDMNRYEETPYCGELSKVNLLNMTYDYGFIKQWSAYYVMREMGVVSARNGYARVSINDSYRGMYLYSEVYNTDALNAFYGYDEGTDGWMVWEESGLECESDSCDDTIVRAMLDTLAAAPSEASYAELQSQMDVDEALKEIAGELIVQQWDGYCAPHNFRYAYNPVTGLIAVLPSSVDLTFDSPVRSVDLYSCSGQRLLRFCQSVDSCAARYDEILLEYADGIEGWMGLTEAFNQILSLVSPYFGDERFVSMTDAAEQAASFERVRTYFLEMPDEIRAQVADH